MFIQFFLLVIILCILGTVIVRFRKKGLSSVQFGFWLLVWVGAGAVVVNPALPQRVADEMGIGRGADLVIYFALVFIVFMQFRMLVRQERMEKEITKVVREIALRSNTPRPDATPDVQSVRFHASQDGNEKSPPTEGWPTGRGG